MNFSDFLNDNGLKLVVGGEPRYFVYRTIDTDCKLPDGWSEICPENWKDVVYTDGQKILHKETVRLYKRGAMTIAAASYLSLYPTHPVENERVVRESMVILWDKTRRKQILTALNPEDTIELIDKDCAYCWIGGGPTVILHKNLKQVLSQL